jgi:uncharacterized protein YutE (UPF0331/DUF86 family)
MKGLRNILVHVYGAVDDAIVYRIATAELDGFAVFKAMILATLSAQQ